MTVGELIEELENFDRNLVVRRYDNDGEIEDLELKYSTNHLNPGPYVQISIDEYVPLDG